MRLLPCEQRPKHPFGRPGFMGVLETPNRLVTVTFMLVEPKVDRLLGDFKQFDGIPWTPLGCKSSLNNSQLRGG